MKFKQLDCIKAISTICEYIQSVYDSYYKGKEPKPLTIYCNYTLRDMACAALCRKAIGSKNIKVIFTKREYRCDSFSKMGLDFDAIEIFLNYIEHVEECHGILERVEDIPDAYFKYEGNQFSREDIRQSVFEELNIRKAEVDDHLSATSANFGHVALNNEEYSKYASSNPIKDVIFPLYCFADDEVMRIAEFFGISCFMEEYSKALRKLYTFKYSDTPFERTLKIARSSSMNLLKLDIGELIQMRLDNCPEISGVPNEIQFFFIGMCEGCYRY